MSKAVALGAMTSRGVYPLEFLTTLSRIIGVDRAAPAIREVREPLRILATSVSE